MLPKGWAAGQCGIFLSCANNADVDVFRYRDVAAEAANIIEKCVDAKPYIAWGGLDSVGQVGTFYVSVGAPVDRRGNVRLLPPGIGTSGSVTNVSTS